MILNDLYKADLLKDSPKWLQTNTHYLTITGSYAYGSSTDLSDIDIYGIAIPPLDILFPHLQGHIPSFMDNKVRKFQQWQKHHIQHNSKEYDFSIYSLPRYFQLVTDGNPNMIDTLFTDDDCILHCTSMGYMIRDNRELFLSNNVIEKFLGYAKSQLHKTQNKKPEGKRRLLVEKYGFDVKFASHIVRLLLELQDLITSGEMNLRRSSDLLKSIRNGEFTLEEIITWYSERKKLIRKLEPKSVLRDNPNIPAIKQLLINCIETVYGSITKSVLIPSDSDVVLKEIQDVLDKYS